MGIIEKTMRGWIPQKTWSHQDRETWKFRIGVATRKVTSLNQVARARVGEGAWKLGSFFAKRDNDYFSFEFIKSQIDTFCPFFFFFWVNFNYRKTFNYIYLIWNINYNYFIFFFSSCFLIFFFFLNFYALIACLYLP